MPINDSRTLALKVSQLNEIFKDVQAYKQAHPEGRVGCYTRSYGSLLNAYREGDVTFEECIELLKAIPPHGAGESEGEAVALLRRWERAYRDYTLLANKCPDAGMLVNDTAAYLLKVDAPPGRD